MKFLTNTRAAMGGLALAALTAAGIGLTAAPANAASTSTWDKIAQCESSGNWHINTGNGYYGGLQFSLSTWHAFGGSGNPASASKSTQIRIAERVLASQGWGAWPACSARLGLHGHVGATSVHHVTHHAKHHVTHHAKHHAVHVKLSKKTYTVHSGDTLAKIAAKLHVRGGWHRLAKANVNTVSNPNLIFPGQRLRLPA
jgi:nucleoid-associated protein YgaU